MKRHISLLLTAALLLGYLSAFPLPIRAEDSGITEPEPPASTAPTENPLDPQPTEETNAPLAPGLMAAGTVGTGFSWELSHSGTLTISGSGTGLGGSSASGMPWYEYRNSVYYLVIQEGAEYIGERAFSSLSSLISVTLPDSVVSIASFAFERCGSLQSIHLPKGVKTVVSSAFSNCDSLTAFTVDADNPWFSGDETGVLFNKDKTVIERLPYGYKGAYTIPEGVVGIGGYAFSGCEFLTSVSIPASVTYYGDGAFSQCDSLSEVHIQDLAAWCKLTASNKYTSILSDGVKLKLNGNSIVDLEIPEGVTAIGHCAFYDCDTITTVKLPSSVTKIGQRAFGECGSLSQISGLENVTVIDTSAFRRCTSLQSFTIPSGVVKLGTEAFLGCTNLRTVNLNEGLTSIGNQAFSGCNLLSTITFPSTLETIGTSAFRACSQIKTLEIPESVKTIGAEAFLGCHQIPSVRIPAGVTEIGDNAFYGCSRVEGFTVDEKNTAYSNDARGVLFNKDKTVLFQAPGTISGEYEVPGTVDTIDADAFYSCIGLETLTVAQGVTTIGEEAFHKCLGLKKVTLPASLVSIGRGGFSTCDSLETVELREGLQELGNSAFAYCGALENISIPKSVTSMGAGVFSGCASLASVELPAGITQVGNSMFNYCRSLVYVTIPDGVTQIGRSAFNSCDMLSHILFTGTEEQWDAISVDSYNNELTEAIIHCEAKGDEITLHHTCDAVIVSCTLCDGDVVSKTNPEHTFENGVCTQCGVADGWKYRVADGKVTITGFDGTLTDLVIPGVLVGCPVTAIEAEAFKNNEALRTVTIPDSVTDIYTNAFYGCRSLVAVKLGKGLKTVAANAFGYTYIKHVIYSGTEEQWSQIEFAEGNWLQNVFRHSGETDMPITCKDSCSALVWSCSLCQQAIAHSLKGTADHSWENGSCTKCGVSQQLKYRIDQYYCKVTVTGHTGNPLYLQIPETVEGIGVVGLEGYYDWDSMLAVKLPAGISAFPGYVYQVPHILYTGTLEQWEAKTQGNGQIRATVHTDVEDDPLTVERLCSAYVLHCAECGGPVASCETMPEHDYEAGVCRICHAPQGLTYTVGADGLVTVTGYTGGAEHLVIPEKIAGYPVGGIGANALCKSTITAITIPKTVGFIGEEAFAECYALREVHISDLAAWCAIRFENARANPIAYANTLYLNGSPVTQLTIPDGVDAVGDYAFNGLSSLTDLDLGNVTRIGCSAFDYCIGLRSVYVPSSVKEIGESAFAGCDAVEELRFAEGLVSIGARAFSGASMQKVIELPQSLKSIGDFAFIQAASVTVHPGVETIGCNALGYYHAVFTGTQAQWEAIEKEEQNVRCIHFGVTASITKRSVCLVDVWHCSVCNGDFFASPVEGGAHDFVKGICKDCGVSDDWEYWVDECAKAHIIRYLGSKAEVVIPATLGGLRVTRIEGFAKSGNTTLKEVTVPAGVEYIDGFAGCKYLHTVVLSEGLREIGYGAFQNCGRLKNITIPDTVEFIREGAFEKCTSLQQIRIPDGVEELETEMFHGCTALVDVILPDSLVTIGVRAFQGCTKLARLDIPKDLEDVQASAFSGCTKLKSVYVDEMDTWFNIGFHVEDPSDKTSNPLIYGADLYVGGELLTDLYLTAEGEAESLHARQFVGCGSLQNVHIGKNYQGEFKPMAFEGCTNLEGFWVDPENICWENDKNGVLYAKILPDSGREYRGLVIVPRTYSGTFVVPEDVDNIFDSAFYACKQITAVELPEAMMDIGYEAFYGCSGLKTVIYNGYQSDVETILIHERNEPLLKASWKYVQIEESVGGSAISGIYRTDGTLILRNTGGDGIMPDIEKRAAPWYKDYRKSIRYVQIRGVERIGANLLYGCPNIQSVSYNYSLERLAGVEVVAEGNSDLLEVPWQVTGETPEITVSAVPESGEPVVSWEAVPGAVKYTVSRATSKTGTYSTRGSTTDCSYIDSGTTEGKEYWYRLTVKLSNGISVVLEPESACGICAQPDVTWTLSATTGQPTLSWKKVAGAYRYEILRADAVDGEFVSLSLQKGTSFTDKTAQGDTVYYYKVNVIATKAAANSADMTPLKIACAMARPAIKAAVAGSGKPLVTWNAVSGAVSYNIFRSTSSKGTYTYLGSSTDASYEDGTAEVAVVYYYKVSACGTVSESVQSDYKSVRCCINAPNAQIARDDVTGKPVISWDAVEGAKKYEVHRATSANGSYTRRTTTDSLAYTDTGATPGKTYYYKVYAVPTNTKAKSVAGNVVSMLAICAQPDVKVTYSETTGQPTLSWKKVTGAYQYEILRAEENSNGFTSLVTQKGTSYTDKTVTGDTVYYYMVRAAAKDSEISSVDMTPITAVPRLAKPVVKTDNAVSGNPRLTWDAVAGAKVYAVYRAPKSKGEYVRIGETAEPVFTDETAVVGTTYYYKVCALGNHAESASAMSSYRSILCKAAGPVAQIQRDYVTGKPVISWEAVEGAKRYEIQRATSANGRYSSRGTTTSLMFADTGAGPGNTYYYRVYAVPANTKAKSAGSEPVSMFAICAQPNVKVTYSASGQYTLSWSRVTGVYRYEILRADSPDGEFRSICMQTGTSYTDKEALTDTLYYYKVFARGKTDATDCNEMEPLAVAKALYQPKISKLTNNPETGKPVLEWNAASGAVSYNIYRATRSNGEYTIVGSTSEAYFEDTSAELGKTYYYKMTACGAVSESAKSGYKSIRCKCAAPVAALTLVNGDPSVSWGAVEGAKKYEIHRATSETGRYTRVKTVTDLSWTDTTAREGRTYYYKVKAVNENTAANSAFSNVVSNAQ